MKQVIGSIILSVFAVTSTSAQTAEEAWKALVGSKYSPRPAFAFVENNPDLPNVLIYGDSISMGYTPTVREELAGKANVYRIHRNGGDSARVIPVMTKMNDVMGEHWPFKWDVIQFNVGLHDLKYLNKGKYDTKNGKQVRSTEDYKKNLEKIIQYFKGVAPKAILIFATTTPVPENSTGRIAGDAARYNQAARELLKAYPEIIINDLHAFTKPNMSEWTAGKGNVHYNAKGRTAQGEEVARIIGRTLK